MIHVVGGAYLEYCDEPYWSQLYGSGGRAAAALTSLSERVELSTYISDEDRGTLGALAGAYGFSVNTLPIDRTIAFIYRHALAEPQIDVMPRRRPTETHTVTAPNVLRFGFIEGDPIVDGERVVYDPQAGVNALPFDANRSTARHLAVVANRSEAEKLAGTADLAEAGRTLLEQGAEVVVVKRGVFGATVFTVFDGSGAVDVPAYRTDSVWPIGSGDVFSAVFAHFWAEREAPPVEAATMASLATAHYCNSRSLTIPADPARIGPFPALRPNPSDISAPLIYLAGPFFTMAQRWLVTETKNALEAQGLSVFSPFHDIGIGPAHVVAGADIAALDACSAVLALLDSLDAGTLFEVGYARARRIPVIGFTQNERRGDMTMLEGTKCEVVSDFSSAIYRTAWAAMRQ